MAGRTKKPSKTKVVRKSQARKPQIKVSAKGVSTKTPVKTRDSLAQLRTHVDQIEKRLKRANTLTRSSVKALKSSYESLGARTGGGAGSGDMGTHIEALSNRLTGLIEQTRKDVAHDLQVVVTDPRLETLSAALTKANQRLTKAEAQQAGAIGAINNQIASLATAIDERLQNETRARERMQDVLTQRIETVEDSSADALKQIGEKVVSVSEALTQQADDLKQNLAEDGLARQQDYEEHKADMARRIEALEDDQRNSVPSIERRLVTMSTRLEALELSPPHVYDATPDAPLPYEPAPQMKAQNIEQEIAPDAFSPSEPEQMQIVPPPVNPYAGQAEAVQAQSDAVQNGAAPQEYVPQEYVPEQYAEPETVANPYIVPTPEPIAPGFPAPTHAPYNPETGAFEPAGGGADIPPMPPFMQEQAAPPPMPLNLAPISTQDETMDAARPGVDPKAKKKRRRAKGISGNGLSSISSPLKIAALMVGVAVVGLFAAKAVLPKVIGGDAPTPSAGRVTPQDFTSMTPAQSAQAGSSNFETVKAVGDYSGEMQAPDLGDDQPMAPSVQKLTLEAAATKGDPIAQFQLGLSHLEAGRDADAVRLIRLAANQGQPAAQYRLGKLYEFGIGVKASPKTAMELMKRSADAGNRIAMHDLGHYHATGSGGQDADITQAVTWFEKAAQRGVLDSQFNLGVLYQGGAGIEKNLISSYVWYAVAGGQGDKVALQRRDMLAGELSSDQLAQAQARAKAFAPKRVNDLANGVFRNLPWAQPVSASVGASVNVKDAQKILASLGYDIGSPDGAMGPKTRNAVINFERANGMPETGRVDAALMQRLSLAAGV